MNKDQFAGKWRELKGKVKEKWGRLTDDDISKINGKYDQLAGQLQRKYGWAKEQAEREINSWCSSCEERRDRRETEMDRSKEQKFWNSQEITFEEEQRPQNQEEWHKRGEPKKPSGNGQNKNKKRKAG